MAVDTTRRAFVGGIPLLLAGSAAGAESLAPADSVELQAKRLVSGGSLFVPSGYHQVHDTIRPPRRTRIAGVGPNASTLTWASERSGEVIALADPTREGPTQCTIEGLGFHSTSTVDKIAVSLINAANIMVREIGIAAGAWLGPGAVGIRTSGRQFVRIRDCDIACARPIVFAANLVFPTLAADFFTIDSCDLACTASDGACIAIEDGAVFSNVRISDTAMAGGANGFLFRDRTSKGASINLQFSNVRTEQGTTPDAWSFDIDSSVQSIQSVLFENVRCDLRRNGIRIRNGQRITLINVDIDQMAGRTALDIEFVPGTVLTIIGSFRQYGSRIRLKNARRVLGSGAVAAGDFQPFEQWVYQAGANGG